MTGLNLPHWIALLSEAGVKFESGPRLRAATEAAASRLNLTLAANDLNALEGLEAELNPSPEPSGTQKRGFSALDPVAHVPLLDDPIPSRPLPGRGGGVIAARASASASASTAVAVSLPPWGLLEEKLQGDLRQSIVPIDWKPADGGEVTLAKWDAFIKQLVDGIGSRLWPVYQPGGASWSTSEIGRLFDADFQLLGDLQFNLGMPISGMFPSMTLHNRFFTEEDDGKIAFGTGYDRYDPTVAPLVLSNLPAVMIAGMAGKGGTLDLQLKVKFQRPRPYQVALLQNRNDFSYRGARTGGTPSLVSGHCLQGSIAGCTAFVAFAKQLSLESIEVLKQFTVDIGDRRVFAGIHYPSDNLSSWYTALSLVPLVFDAERGPAARHFLWSAISKYSTVYAAVSAYKDASGNSPYTAILEELKRLGTSDRA
jgi:hypothetical protein